MQLTNKLSQILAAGAILLSNTGCTIGIGLDKKLNQYLSEDPTNSLGFEIVNEEYSAMRTKHDYFYLNEPEIKKTDITNPVQKETFETLNSFTHDMSLDFTNNVDIKKLKIKKKFYQNELFQYIQIYAIYIGILTN